MMIGTKRCLWLAAAGLAAACSDAAGPAPRPHPAAAVAASSGVVLDQQSATLNDATAWPQGGMHVGKGFLPTNPHPGDAIIATFFWRGTTNTITSVGDHFCDPNSTPIGNTYHFIDYVTAGGYSMATYVATNVQGFSDTASSSDRLVCVHALFSNSITEGGVIISAYSGVASVSTEAIGDHHSGVGSASTTTVGDPGAITAGTGALAYAVTMADGVAGSDPPPGFTDVTDVSDSAIKADAEYEVLASGGTVEPKWTWYFQAPHSWLATVLALNPATTTVNQPPVAAFTSSCSGLTCGFTNSSSDPDGTIASNSWTFGDGGTSTAQNPSHTYGAGGTYTVTLTVTDNQGATNSVSQTVTVTAPNQAPVAAFSSSCSGLTCGFTNSSSDPDGTIASNSWSFGDGGTSTAANPSHTYGAGGTYTVTLTVTDNQGATNSVSHTVTVTVANQPPVAAFTSSCSVLTCGFTSSSSDPDGTISAYSWTFGDGGTSTVQNPSHAYSAGGTYTVTLTVTDNQGATSSVSHTVTVTAPDQAPVVDAGPNQTVLLGVLYTLNWSFSDPDNGPWNYTINWGDGSSTSGSTASTGSHSTGHTYLGLLSNRTITVTVTDSNGASGSSSKVITLIL